MIVCPCCNKNRRALIHIPSRDEWICKECLEKSDKYILCDLCNEWEWTGVTTPVTLRGEDCDRQVIACNQCLNAWNGRFRYCAYHERKEEATPFDIRSVRIVGEGNGYLCQDARADCWSCSDCGAYIMDEDDTHHDDNDDVYCSHCFNNGSSDDCDDCDDFCEEWRGRESLVDKTESNTHNQCLTHLTYGLELETSHINRDNNNVFSRIEDGSISGMEYVSPILNGDKGFQAIKDFLDNVSAEIDSDCGYHLHVGLNHMSSSRKQQFALVRSLYVYKNFEKYFFDMVKENRTHNNYCISLQQAAFGDATTYQELDDKYNETGDSRDDKWHAWRYYWANYHSYWYRETIELRLHHGTLDYDEITNWVNLHGKILEWCSEITFAAFRTRLAKIKNHGDFLLFVKEIVSEQIAIYYEHLYVRKRIDTTPTVDIREATNGNLSELPCL